MSKIIKHTLRATFFALLVYMLYDIYMGHWGVKSYLNSRQERIRLTKEHTRLMTEKAQHEKDLEALKTNPLFMEEQIKINLKKGNRGEIYYHFPEKK